MRRAQLLPSCAIVASFLIACADDSQGSNSSIFAAGNPGGESGDDTAESNDESSNNDPDNDTSGDDSSDADDWSETDDSGGDDSIKFDIPSPDFASADNTPCGVDVLFVIDNSGSMSKHKTEIVAAFGSFIDEMINALAPGTPVHIAVTRATGFYDPGNGSGWSDPSCEFGFIDGTWNPPTLTKNGINGQQGRLFENEGKTFFEYDIGDDPTMLAQWFESTLASAIVLDFSSNTESVVAAAAYAFDPVNDEFNAGFLREKAVLVLFLMSDAPDAAPSEIPTSVFVNMVSEAKAGCGDGCILPTGIIQAMCYEQPGNINNRLTDFMNGFGGPPTALDYFTMQEAPESFTSVLGATLAESIAYTCEHVVPVE
jgi:hypothetical protein